MIAFAHLLDRLSYEASRNAKLRLMRDYFARVPDPERGWALASLTGALTFRNAKPALIRALMAERIDPVLFAMSYDYVGDLSETVALLWPAAQAQDGSNHPPLLLSEVVETLTASGKLDLPKILTLWLDALDETGRWALLKIITGGLRVGVSARLAKTAAADLGNKPADDIEQIWHGLTPPYENLFAWLEGRAAQPVSDNPAPFRPVMLAHPLDEPDLASMNPADFAAEWKWDGIRIQISRGFDAQGNAIVRLYSRTGEDVTNAFPDLAESFAGNALPAFAIDGELLIMRDGAVQSFGVLQQRLNRKTVSAKLVAEHPAHVRAYDLLSENNEDVRDLPFDQRRARLQDFVARANNPKLDLSPLVPFGSWDQLAQKRHDPAGAGGALDAGAVEGLMLKQRASAYLPGRPKGPWFKWKRDPFNVDAVMMYAQRGHGKRSSFYSDFTFGVWRDSAEGQELVPVGKAYFGFTDEELIKLDRHVRNNSVDRFGPVTVVAHRDGAGLVLEIAFEGLNRSTRHKSGIAMRFPRIARIRWDKPALEADRLETLEKLLPD